MTDELKAPERIWIEAGDVPVSDRLATVVKYQFGAGLILPFEGRVEYVRADLTTPVADSDAAEICADMAREAATQAARNNSSALENGDEFALGAAAQYNAQADALREAERRIRALIATHEKSATGCEFCDHPTAFFPAVIEDEKTGVWIHRGRDDEAEACTNIHIQKGR